MPNARFQAPRLSRHSFLDQVFCALMSCAKGIGFPKGLPKQVEVYIRRFLTTDNFDRFGSFCIVTDEKVSHELFNMYFLTDSAV